MQYKLQIMKHIPIAAHCYAVGATWQILVNDPIDLTGISNRPTVSLRLLF